MTDLKRYSVTRHFSGYVRCEITVEVDALDENHAELIAECDTSEKWQHHALNIVRDDTSTTQYDVREV